MFRYIAALVLLASGFVQACDPPKLSESELIASSDAIYYGRVISVRLPEGTNFNDLPIPHPLVSPESLLRRSQAEDIIIELFVEKTIKGEGKEIVTAEIGWCGSGRASFLEYITLYKTANHWHAIGEIKPHNFNY